MKTGFRSSFLRDLKKIKDRSVLDQVRTVIEEVEVTTDLSSIPHVKKMSGAGAYYRIRVGSYRIGIARQADEVVFVRCLHRRDIYRYFP